MLFGAASAAAAASHDGTYTGVLTCDSRGGLRPLRPEVRVKITGDAASYERQIMVPGRGCPPAGCPSGVFERGAGTVQRWTLSGQPEPERACEIEIPASP